MTAPRNANAPADTEAKATIPDVSGPVSVAETRAFLPLQWKWMVREIEFDNPLEKLLAYEMLAYADENGECFPTVAQLSQALGVGGTQTKNLRRSLVARGILRLVEKGTGRGRASVYLLTFAADKTDTHPPNKTDTLSVHQEGHQEPIYKDLEERATMNGSGSSRQERSDEELANSESEVSKALRAARAAQPIPQTLVQSQNGNGKVPSSAAGLPPLIVEECGRCLRGPSRDFGAGQVLCDECRTMVVA
jgi:hypothetical protein